MKEVFKKVIDKLVIPEFPWVIDCELTTIEVSDITFISVVYYISGEFDVSEHYKKLNGYTRSLYKMIGGVDGVDDIFVKYVNKNDGIV